MDYTSLRDSFRINDEIELEYKQASDAELEHPDFEAQCRTTEQLELLTALQAIDQEIHMAMRVMQTENKDVVHILRLFNQKLHLITDPMTSDPALNDLPTLAVNISESGIAFPANDSFPIGTCLKLRFILKPKHAIQAYGHVVNMSENPAEYGQAPYIVAVRFSHMLNADKQKLARHILHKQAEMRRQKKT